MSGKDMMTDVGRPESTPISERVIAARPRRLRLVRRSVFAVVLAAAAVFAGALVAPSPAAASVPQLTRVVVSSGAPTISQRQVAYAECPNNTVLINAGGAINGPGGDVAMDDIYPDVAGNRVRVTARETDPSGNSWSVSAVATCADSMPGLEWEDGTSLLDSDDHKQGRADCDPGKTLVGNGMRIHQGTGEVLLTSIAPQYSTGDPADAVVADAREEDGNFTDDWSITAYAACADPLVGQRVEKTATAMDSADPKYDTAYCGSGEVATGGSVGLVQSPAALGNIVIDGMSTGSNLPSGEPNFTSGTAYVEDPFVGIWMMFQWALCATA